MSRYILIHIYILCACSLIFAICCLSVSVPCPYFAYPEDKNQFGPMESGSVVPLWHCVAGTEFDEGTCTCCVKPGLCSGHVHRVYVADMMWLDHKSVGWYNTVDAVDIAKMS